MSEPAEFDGTPPSQGAAVALKLAKGCGCLVACAALALGVALVGDGRPESWGSALVGVLFLVLIVGTSGVNGFWNR